MIYILYGVSGVGKTTLGKAWAKELSLPFFDADDFHPALNKDKMSGGQALTDEDRWPWLEKLKATFPVWENNGGAVLACSALKEKYRAFLLNDHAIPLHYILLDASKEKIKQRMEVRDHFMPPALLDSQFDALEKATYGTTINVENSIAESISQLKNKINNKTDIGLFGLGVMGRNLALNIASNDFSIATYNRHVAGSEEHIAQQLAAENPTLPFTATASIEEFVEAIALPRKIILMIPAGKTVDLVIDQLTPFLDPGDIIIDGGNSHFEDSIRRTKSLAARHLHFYGIGISGGAKGARKGPALMPSGAKDIYPQIAPILDRIAAKDAHGNPCSGWIGKAGSGHFVKMIHNGIEYGEMQLIAEIYHALRFYANKTVEEIARLFEAWQETDTASYLLGISAKILQTKEGETPLIDHILDQAGNKGTGNWSAKAAFELGTPFNVGSAALQARFISAFKAERIKASKQFKLSKGSTTFDLDQLQQAYQMARIINHTQGLKVLQHASENYQWELDLAATTRIWTNGCIIRSQLMEEWTKCLAASPADPLSAILENKDSANGIKALTAFVQKALGSACPVPTHTAALNYFLGMHSEQTSANMIQAQRDFFGQHTFKRTDQEGSFTYSWE